MGDRPTNTDKVKGGGNQLAIYDAGPRRQAEDGRCDPREPASQSAAISAVDRRGDTRATPELRREQIKHQITLITALMDVRGYAAPQTKAAVERAHLLTKQAEALGEPA